MESYNDWLAHFGIEGMKWGQRNGPPYPLKTGQMSSREQKFNKSLAKTKNSTIRRIKYNHELSSVTSKMNNARNELDRWKLAKERGREDPDRIKELISLYKDGKAYVDNILHDAEKEGFVASLYESIGSGGFSDLKLKGSIERAMKLAPINADVSLGRLPGKTYQYSMLDPQGIIRTDYQYAKVEKKKG